MNKHASLPIKLAEIQRDLHAFLQMEPAGSAHRALIDEADKAIDKVIQEFDQEGKRHWITLSGAADTGRN